MSQENPAGGKAAAARQKAEQMRKADEAKARRRNILVASVITLVVVALAAGVFLLIQQNKAEPLPAAEGGEPMNVLDDGAIGVGDESAPVTATVYLDYMCPACGAFEEVMGPEMKALADEGKLLVKYRVMDNLNHFSRGTEYSTRSAGAAYCVANSEPESFFSFNELLLAKQPAEQTKGLTNDRIAEIASEAGVETDILGCLDTDQFEAFATKSADEARDRGLTATPTLFINDEESDIRDPQQLRAEVERLAGGDAEGEQTEGEQTEGE